MTDQRIAPGLFPTDVSTAHRSIRGAILATNRCALRRASSAGQNATGGVKALHAYCACNSVRPASIPTTGATRFQYWVNPLDVITPSNIRINRSAHLDQITGARSSID